MRNEFLALPFLILPLAAAAESTQCTAINLAPATISMAGSYCLTGDLSSATPSGIAITIAADNVQLDLNGHTIVGPGGSNTGVGVYASGRAGLVVRNGYIRNFWIGVDITDPLVGFPPITPSGASKRHEVSQLHIDSSYLGINLLGYQSSIHDNIVTNSSGIGINAGASLSAQITGAVNVISNQVFATIAPVGSSTAVFAINMAGTTGSVVQGNIVSQVRGPSGSAGINAGGAEMILSGNRETDISGNPVFCATGGAYTVAKVEGNIDFVSNSYAGNLIYGCSQPSGYANNNY